MSASRQGQLLGRCELACEWSSLRFAIESEITRRDVLLDPILLHLGESCSLVGGEEEHAPLPALEAPSTYRRIAFETAFVFAIRLWKNLRDVFDDDGRGSIGHDSETLHVPEQVAFFHRVVELRDHPRTTQEPHGEVEGLGVPEVVCKKFRPILHIVAVPGGDVLRNGFT